MKIITLIKERTPNFVKNKWVISFLILFVWVLFFEEVNLFSLYKTKSKINRLEKEWVFNEKRIKDAEEKKEMILSDPEKYARETFWMKKEDEELFIIEPTE